MYTKNRSVAPLAFGLSALMLLIMLILLIVATGQPAHSISSPPARGGMLPYANIAAHYPTITDSINTPGPSRFGFIGMFANKDQSTLLDDAGLRNNRPAEGISIHKLPLLNATGGTVTTIERGNATPVTYERLMAFLNNDTTEDATYVDPAYTCSDFAVRLHDAAEAQGIKCAIVSVTFSDGNRNHSVNAFNTIDKGIVFIDDTGVSQADKDGGSVGIDGVVYLEPGEAMGELPANQTDGNLSYAFYALRKAKIDAYNEEFCAFDQDYIVYSAIKSDYDNATRLDGSNLSENSSLLDIQGKLLNDSREELKARYEALKRREETKWGIHSPMGIVKDIKIYW